MVRSRLTSPWKVALWTVPIVGVIAVVFGGLRTGYTFKSMLLWAIAGMAIGGLMVPELEPRSVRVPALWQMCCGLVGGALIAVALQGSLRTIVISALVGVALGFLAPRWLKYFDF